MVKTWRDSSGRDVEIGKTGNTNEDTASNLASSVKTGARNTAEVVERKANQVGDAASRTANDIADEATRQMDAAGDMMRDVLQNVELEELTIRGKLGGHGFQVNIEDEANGKRYLALHLELRTDEGDELRIVGRKILPAVSGGTSSASTSSTSKTETGSTLGSGNIRGEHGMIEGKTSPTGRGGY